MFPRWSCAPPRCNPLVNWVTFTLPGVAYGHLTLQPGGGSAPCSGVIPDWAMLDLFTVGAGTSGRININSLINYLNSPLNPTARLVPLKALLNSVGLAANAPDIYSDSTSVRNDCYGMKQTTGAGAFDTIGEICEISSLANGQATQAGMEATIRRIANLITVRSNTFTIWVLAQSIEPPPDQPSGHSIRHLRARTRSLAKLRAQAVVEQYKTTPGTPNSPVKYRLRYFRYL